MADPQAGPTRHGPLGRGGWAFRGLACSQGYAEDWVGVDLVLDHFDEPGAITLLVVQEKSMLMGCPRV